MTSALHVTGPWRSVQAITSSGIAGFQFTGNENPTSGKGYELTAETAVAAAGSVEWMYDPATGKLFAWAEDDYRALRSSVAAKGLSGSDEAIGSELNDIFRMGAGDDRVYARAGNDILDGGKGNDILHGQQGNDVIDGGKGVDQMFGGEGDDVFYVDDARDQIVEGSGGGNDTAYASVSYALGGDQWVETLATTSRNTKNAINLTGNEYAQTILGNAGANKLNGGGGADRLDGGLGKDTLTGGLGDDAFVFGTKLGKTNVDTVTDFHDASGDKDFFQLDHAVFTALTQLGALVAEAFAANTSGRAADADDRIVYDTDNGKLFYDADGSGKGAAVQFATLTGHPTLTAADFFVI